MIDLHTHSSLSDGALIPAELIRRAQVAGCRAVAITDHADASMMDLILPRLALACRDANRHLPITALWGVELTHVPPPAIAALVQRAREMGAQLVVVHGETVVEPVMPGTNRAAIEAGADILAHPGLISLEDAQLAARRGVHLEISARRSHGLANGHVAQMARQAGARLVIDSDSHVPADLIDLAGALRIGLAAGLERPAVDEVLANSRALLLRLLGAPAGRRAA